MKVKLAGDFSKVPDSNPAPEGVYVGKIGAVDERESNKTNEPMVEVRWTLVRTPDGGKLKDAKGKATQFDPVFTYHPTDPDSTWARRMKELLHALSTGQKGTVDIKEGAEALLRLKAGQDQDGNYRPNVSKIMKLEASVNGDQADEDEEEEDDELDLSELDRAALKKLIKEQGLDIKVTKGMDDDEVREAIAEALGEDEEDEEEDEEEEDEEPEAEEDEDEEEEVDLSELTRAQLKDFIKDNELDVSVKKSDTADSLRIKIADAMGEEEDEEDEDEEPEDNYDELDVATLRQEAKDRELDSTGKKAVLIARLRADDTSAPV
jgi:hypothetical protein